MTFENVDEVCSFAASATVCRKLSEKMSAAQKTDKVLNVCSNPSLETKFTYKVSFITQMFTYTNALMANFPLLRNVPIYSITTAIHIFVRLKALNVKVSCRKFQKTKRGKCENTMGLICSLSAQYAVHWSSDVLAKVR